MLVEIETDPLVPAPSSESWWDVAVAEVSDLDSTVQARKSYEVSKAAPAALPVRPPLGADSARQWRN